MASTQAGLYLNIKPHTVEVSHNIEENFIWKMRNLKQGYETEIMGKV
jgi:hypothetical protein